MERRTLIQLEKELKDRYAKLGSVMDKEKIKECFIEELIETVTVLR